MYRRLLFSTLLILAACAGLPRDPIDVSDLRDPQIPGIDGARYWADVAPTNLNELLADIQRQRRASGLTGPDVTLTLSGGGEDGAFAAGILTAWSEAGTRPEFTSVTGVSTGALTAPFAFLGSDYDDELRRIYGGLEPSNIFLPRLLLSIFPNASLNSSEPLRNLIDEYVTDEFLAEVAAQHNRGRRLLVQTVSLDAQRPVLWDLGQIASSGAPNARLVFRDALLASASIPGIFPPVLIDVEGAQGRGDELHVDGGVYSQSAFLPGWEIPGGHAQGSVVYAIRNSKVDPEADIVKAGISTVTKRSLATLIKTQGVDDLRIAYDLSRQRGGTFRAAWIGVDFKAQLEEPFDPEYMRALFDYGYARFKSGNLWRDRPPSN